MLGGLASQLRWLESKRVGIIAHISHCTYLHQQKCRKYYVYTYNYVHIKLACYVGNKNLNSSTLSVNYQDYLPRFFE